MRDRFNEQLEQLNVELIKMGALCEEAISAATKALLDGDDALRESAAAAEREIDQKERDIENLCMKLLLQQQPVARDLRAISAALKMISDMERIGDQAADIAEITLDIAHSPMISRVPIAEMARNAIVMVTDSIDSFVRKNLSLAQAVVRRDDEVDQLFLDVKQELVRLLGQGRLLPKADPVHKVTIVPRGRALGVTMQLPQQDKYSYDRQDLLTRIAILFGGRIAEEVFMHQMTTGASNDFERATQLARDMVTRYGMSERLGVMVYAESEQETFLGRGAAQRAPLSEATQQQVDAEIRRILDEQYNLARRLIEENQDKMHRMAKALLDWETIDKDQIDDIMEGREPRAPKDLADRAPKEEKAQASEPAVEPAAETASSKATSETVQEDATSTSHDSSSEEHRESSEK